MLRGHFGSVDLIRGLFNPLFRRNLTATSVRCTDDSDRKKVEGVFSWLRDIFRTEPIGYFGWYPSPSSRSFLLMANGMDMQVRGVADCSPRNTKPPIREPNMPEKQERKEEKEKKKKKKKPVMRVDGSENFPDVVAVEGQPHLQDAQGVNYRYQWGIKIPEEPQSRATQTAHREQIWGKVCDINLGRASGLVATMSTSDKEKSTAKPELETQTTQPIGPGIVEDTKTAEPADNLETEQKVREAVATSAKEDSPGDEDYNVPAGTDFDAEISAWKDLVLKSKVPIDTTRKDDFVQANESIDLLSIRPEPPEPKLDIQAVPTVDPEILKDDEVEGDNTKEMKTPMKKLDGKRIGEVHKIDNKKLHTLQSSRFGRFEDNNYSEVRSEGSWTWSTMNRLARANIVTFSTSSDGDWSDAERVNDAKRWKTPPATESASPSSTEAKAAENTQEAASLDQMQTPEYQFHQTDIDAEFADSLNAIAEREMEISLQGTHQDQEIQDVSMNLRERKDSRSLKSEDSYQQHANNFTQYEDDYVAGYESIPIESGPEKSAKEERKKEQQSAEWAENSDAFEKESEEPPALSDNYVNDGEYIRLPGDPYPYSKQYFETWRKATHEIDIGPIVEQKKPEIEAETPIGDARTRKLDILPPARSVSQDAVQNRDPSRGKANGTRRPRSRTEKRARKLSRFSVSSLERRLIPESLRRDAPEKYVLTPRTTAMSWTSKTIVDDTVDEWLSKGQVARRIHQWARRRQPL
nr:uncharacterized protein LOC117220737 isoform X2 [Megalopta genalis]